MSEHATLSGTSLHEDKRIKEPVRVASTANVTIATPGSSIDGVTLSNGDRVLLWAQSTDSQNGIYTWNGAASAMTRTADADSATDFVFGFKVWSREGTANGAKYFNFTTSSTTITIGSTSLTFALDASVDAAQNANVVKAGPATGSPATPTYRSLVNEDFPIDLQIVGTVGAGTLWPASVGASAVALYVGGTSAGPPVTGSFSTGSIVMAQNGSFWICTSGGSPGTWIQMINGAGCRLRMSGNQSTTTGTATTLTWGTEDLDVNGMHFTSTANLTGTVSKNGTATLTGSSTLFSSELSVGQVISVPGTTTEKRVVTAIASNTSLTVATAFVNTASGQTAARLNSPVVFRYAGFFQLDCNVYSAALASGAVTLAFYLNSLTTATSGTAIAQIDPTAINASAGYKLTTARQFNQWDFVEAVWTQNAGTVNVLADERTNFAVNG